MEKKHLLEGDVAPEDWAPCMIALLCHDIGYVRGISRNDADGVIATGVGDETVELPPGASDAVMAPNHVDRSINFVTERFGGRLLKEMPERTDAGVIASQALSNKAAPVRLSSNSTASHSIP